jgi:endonuclease YncB( thermonuclease family)
VPALQRTALMLARHYRTIDGDSLVLLVARYGSFEKRAGVDQYRLNGVRARELRQPAEYDEAGQLTRLSGADARALLDGIMRVAHKIEVDELALDSFGRIIANIEVDDAPLARRLIDAKAVIPGNTQGVPMTEVTGGSPG